MRIGRYFKELVCNSCEGMGVKTVSGKKDGNWDIVRSVIELVGCEECANPVWRFCNLMYVWVWWYVAM